MLNKPGPSASPGEKSFYNRIEHIISQRDDIIGYVEPAMGGSYPDFLLFSPQFGVIIVEIKDYSPEYLKHISKAGEWEHFNEEKIESIPNPFDQIHGYWRLVKDRVNFCRFPKEILVPVIRLVCFSRIPKESIVAEKIREYCPERINICFKEILNRNSAFEEFFNDLIPNGVNLSKEYFNVLRGNIIPSCRLPMLTQANLDKYFSIQDKVKLLDQEQERMARKLGEGHRLIFGVAGSGKTVLLIARARFLAKKNPDWKILILCYNRFLKEFLYSLIIPQDYDADITISTFHGWARNYMLSANNEFSQIYKEALKKAEKNEKMDEFFQVFVPDILMRMLKDLGDQKVFYDVILIDEAQDFEEGWFKAITEVLNPKTNALLLTCDGLQGIYARKKFRWSDVGIQARGRVRKFAKSYRTPMEIGFLAQKALPNNLRNLLDTSDEFISTKEYTGEHGSIEIIESETRAGECRKLAERISQLVKQPQKVFVLFKYNMAKWNYDHPLFKQLKELGVEWSELKDFNQDSSRLLIGTIHGSKGLECGTIIIPEINNYNSNKDRQLLYVGITRARKRLILSAHKSTRLINSLKESK